MKVLAILVVVALVLALLALIGYGVYKGLRAIWKSQSRWEVYEVHNNRKHVIGLQKFDQRVPLHTLYLDDPEYDDELLQAEVEVIDKMQAWNNSRERIKRLTR